MFVQGKYFINHGNKKYYAKARFGFANNYDSWQTYGVRNGIMFEGALGVTFATKKRWKTFVELGQYSSHASGSSRNTDVNALSDIGFNVWFNSFNLTFGIEIGR